MADPDPGRSFFTTLPGILTALAGLLTAAGGFLAAWQAGFLPEGNGGKPESTGNERVTFTVVHPYSRSDIVNLDESIKVGGRDVGTLSTNPRKPSEKANGYVDKGEGNYEYYINFTGAVLDAKRRQQPISGSGQGTIYIEQGGTYDVCYYAGNRVGLVEEGNCE